MANLTQSLTDSVRFFGPQKSTKFGSPMQWGTDKWGNGATTNFSTPETVLSFFSTQSLSFADAYSVTANFFPTVTAAMTFAQGPSQYETLRDKSGIYYYVFKGGTTNMETAYVPTYSTSAAPSNSWSQSTTSSITWTAS
jgi:hypothetical protein